MTNMMSYKLTRDDAVQLNAKIVAGGSVYIKPSKNTVVNHFFDVYRSPCDTKPIHECIDLENARHYCNLNLVDVRVLRRDAYVWIAYHVVDDYQCYRNIWVKYADMGYLQIQIKGKATWQQICELYCYDVNKKEILL